MCTEIVTFDVNNATKNCHKIIDLGPYKIARKILLVIDGITPPHERINILCDLFVEKLKNHKNKMMKSSPMSSTYYN